MRPDLKCPLCAGQLSKDIGRIFHREPVRVAGVPIDLGNTKFNLFECDTCQLRLKLPLIPESKLLECYAQASDNNWGEDPDPIARRFDKICRLARIYSTGNRVLDIGCFNGAMLHHFGPYWDRYGVEPSHAAAQSAAKRGIKILGRGLGEASATVEQFDVITAIDVIEHLITPMAFFDSVDRLLKPGGIVILLTADSKSWPWRLEGSRYWYCSLPEHVCFWSLPSIMHLGKIYEWNLQFHQTLRHQVSGLSKICVETLRAASFITAYRLNGLGMPFLQRRLNRSAPTWITAPDHMLCILKKAARHLGRNPS